MPASASATTRSSMLALIGLLAVAAAWGSSFPLTKALLARMSAVNFNAVRFTLAAIVMLALFARSLRSLGRRGLTLGMLLGVTYGVAQLVQTTGLEHTPASVSGFITGTYVVLTPICAALLLRTPIGPRVWIGAGLATVGLGLLALNGLSLGFGEALTLASALIYALHIVGLGAWSTASAALGLGVIQIVGCAAVSLLAALVFDHGRIILPSNGFDWTALIYMALVSGALAMVVQSWAQAHLAPSRAAIIMSTEPAWAAGFAIAFLHEPLTWRIGLGGLTMLAAMLVVELQPRRAGRGDRNR